MPGHFPLAARLALIVTLAASTAAAQAPATKAANPGTPGNNGGPGGPGGPGGGGGGWGGRGGGNNVSDLLQVPIVQDDLKLTDKQKAAIKLLGESSEKKKAQVLADVTKMATAAAAEAAAAAAEAGDVAVADPNAANNNNNNGRGGRGGRGGSPAVRQAVTGAMTALQAEIDAAFLKPLDARQRTRIKQIALQVDGTAAFTKPELIARLGLTEDQVDAIQSIRDESRNSQQQIMGQFFNNGGPGGGRGQRPDPATFQTPEFQAKIQQAEVDQKKLTNATMAAVGKVLTKSQKATYKNAIGEPFDVNAIRGSFFARFRPPTPPADAQASAATTTTPAAPATAAAPTKPATAATPAASAPAPAATTRPAARKSLRESRGGSPQP